MERTFLVAHPSADLYGSDRVLLESVAGMVAAGWRVVATVPSPGPLVAELRTRGAVVAFCPVPVVRKSALRPRGFARLLLEVAVSLRPAVRLLRTSAATDVYVNTVTIPSWIVLGRLLGRRVSCHVHEAEGSASPVLRRLLYLPLLGAQQILVNSSYSRSVLGRTWARLAGRTTLIYNGVPGPPAPARARVGLSPPLRLLFLGRLSPRKGPQVAIAALAELRRGGADVRLDLLGHVFAGYEWFHRELVAAVADAGLQDVVGFLGFDADVWPHIAAADVVLVPSVVDEPFGNAAVEAVLGARPLVASATSGLREAAAGYACVQLVEPARPDLLAVAVRRVADRWPHYREAAWADSGVARERHSVQRYQHDLVAALSGPRPG